METITSSFDELTRKLMFELNLSAPSSINADRYDKWMSTLLDARHQLKAMLADDNVLQSTFEKMNHELDAYTSVVHQTLSAEFEEMRARREPQLKLFATELAELVRLYHKAKYREFSLFRRSGTAAAAHADTVILLLDQAHEQLTDFKKTRDIKHIESFAETVAQLDKSADQLLSELEPVLQKEQMWQVQVILKFFIKMADDEKESALAGDSAPVFHARHMYKGTDQLARRMREELQHRFAEGSQNAGLPAGS